MRLTILFLALTVFLTITVHAQPNDTIKHLYILIVNDRTQYSNVNIQEEVTNFFAHTPNPGDSVIVISGSTSREILTYNIPDSVKSNINSNLRLKYAQKGDWDSYIQSFSTKKNNTATLFSLTATINSAIPSDKTTVPVICFINMTKPLMESGACDFLQPVSAHHLPASTPLSLCTAAINVVDIDEGFDQSETSRAQTLWSQYAERLGAAIPRPTVSKMFYQTISKGTGEIAKENCADRMNVNKQIQTSQRLSGGSIVLTWDNPECDLDLYGKIGHEVLFYKHPETSFGKHYRQLKVGNELLLIGEADSIEIEIRHVNGPPPINARIVAKDRDNNVISSRNIDQFQTQASYRQPGNVLIIGSDSICKP